MASDRFTTQILASEIGDAASAVRLVAELAEQPAQGVLLVGNCGPAKLTH